MNIDRLYDIRNLGVTIMRTAVVSIGLAALATLYLGSVSSASATYGGGDCAAGAGHHRRGSVDRLCSS